MQSIQMPCIWCLAVLAILLAAPWGQGFGAPTDNYTSTDPRVIYCTQVLNQTNGDATNCGGAPSVYKVSEDKKYLILLCCLGGLGRFNMTYRYRPFMNDSLITYIGDSIKNETMETKMAQYIQECGSKRNVILNETYFPAFDPTNPTTCPN